MFGADPPDQIAPASVNEGAVRPEYDPDLAETGASEAERIRDDAQTLPSRRPPIESLRPGDWKLIKQVISNRQLLTIGAAESIEYGLASAIIRDDQELCRYFGTLNGDPALDLVRWGESWSESMVRVLISWWVRALLGVIFVVALFLELAAPGVGVFGATAAGALLVLIGAPFLAGMAEWWEILLILAGIALIGVEVFVTPGFGIPGVLGIASLLVGLVGSFVSRDVTTSAGQSQLLQGIGWTIVVILAGGVALWLLSRHLRELPMFRRMVLSAAIGETAAAAAEREETAPPEPAAEAAGAFLAVGDEGVAETDLRPAGRALVHDRMIDVVAAGGWISAGTPVRITRCDRFRIEVERAVW
jgi:membrane-bound serine protease (ClpP class)